MIFLLCLLITLPLILYLLHLKYSQTPSYDKAKDEGKSILITGCDSGFGRALAERLACSRVHVFATCLTAAGVDELRAHPCEEYVHPFQLDVRDQRGIDHLKTYVIKTLLSKRQKNVSTTSTEANSNNTDPDRSKNPVIGYNRPEIQKPSTTPPPPLWGLVSNAGFFDVEAPDDWLTLDDYHRHMEVNCYGAMRVVKAFKPLVKRARGRIVIVTSIRARLFFGETGPYTMSKFALEAYADGLRQEMYYFGVGVSIVQPGGFTTALNKDCSHVAENIENIWEGLPDDLKEQWPHECVKTRAEGLRSNSSENRAADLTPVVGAMEHALYAGAPQSRYVVGADAWLHYLPLSLLPGRLQDAVLRRWFFRRLAPPLPPSAAAGDD